MGGMPRGVVMAFPDSVPALTDLPQWAHEYYTQDGTAFRLNVKTVGANEDVTGLKNALDSERRSRAAAEKSLGEMQAQYKDVDPAQYKELIQLRNDKKLLDDKGVEAVVAERTQSFKTTIEDQKRQIDAWTEKVRVSELAMKQKNLHLNLEKVAREAGVAETAVPDAVWRLSQIFTDFGDNGMPISRTANGTVQYGKDGLTPLTPKEHMESLKDSAAHLWPTSNGTNTNHQIGANGQKTIVLSFEDAKDNRKYMAAMAQADKIGADVLVQ